MLYAYMMAGVKPGATSTPAPYGSDPYSTKPQTLSWTPPSWYNPSVPTIVEERIDESVVAVPVISMMPVHRGPKNYVRAFDSMPENGYPLFEPPVPSPPNETDGRGLNVPQSPAPGEGPWTKFPQYSSQYYRYSE